MENGAPCTVEGDAEDFVDVAAGVDPGGGGLALGDDGPGEVGHSAGDAHVDALLLVASFLFALFLRSYWSYRLVFTPTGIRLPGTDPWYHLRLVEHLVANFPSRMLADPYLDGTWIPIGPLFDYQIAITALLLGGGSPSTGLVQAVAAWTPAVMGLPSSGWSEKRETGMAAFRGCLTGC